MHTILPASAAKWQPLRQTAAVLLLGQGFSRAEFLTRTSQLSRGLTAVPPFNATGAYAENEGRLTILADACVGIDLGVKDPLPAAPRALLLDAAGATLQQGLDQLSLSIMPGDPLTGTAPKASGYWGLDAPAGPTTKLIAILRKPTDPAAPPAECYQLPVVAVDVHDSRPWHLVVVRALAQLLAGLADEFIRSGPDWQAPPVDWLTDPLHPTAPPQAGRLGPNVIVVNAAQTARLGHEPLASIVRGADPVWVDPHAGGATPYRPKDGAAVIGEDPTATIRLAEGGGGFRTGVLRCDHPCLLRQVPAMPIGPQSLLDGDPIGAPAVELCPVCRAATARALGGAGGSSGAKRHRLDGQVSQYGEAGFTTRTPVTVTATGAPAQTVETTVDGGAVWKFTAEVDVKGLSIREMKLASRPGDPMAASDDVAESITFEGLAYDVGSGPQPLTVSDALANLEHPPRLEIGRTSIGLSRVGVKLTVHWQPVDGLLVRAEMSLVCRTIANDFDPGGAAEACKFYPQITLTWSRSSLAVKQVLRLHGTVVVVANNRVTDPGPDHGGMTHGSQAVMLLADSNSSKEDNDYHVAANDPLLVTWASKRLMGNLDSPRGTGAFHAWMLGVAPLLPEWSWLFDYGRALPVSSAETVEVVAWESLDRTRGSFSRPLTVAWPPEPSPHLGGIPRMTVIKTPRQGAYDNVHLNADMGVDTAGRQLIAAPFCADLCLHLHVRWGVHAAASATNDPLPFLGWTSGPHATSHSALGAPLVPPNQRISFGVTRPDAAHTRIRYVAEVARPAEGRAQVILEQGLGFAFTYNGLDVGPRILLAGVYADPAHPLVAAGFIARNDADTRQFFRGIYERIRFYSYGYAGSVPPQQIPTDQEAGEQAITSPFFRSLVDL